MATVKKSAKKKTTKKRAPLTSQSRGAEIIRSIRSELKHVSFKRTQRVWLDTGSKELNAVLGEEDRGIPYGKIIEISGENSNGKTGIVMDLVACAQAQGAKAVWVDFENSFDPDWAARRGVDVEGLVLVSPLVGTFGKDKTTRLSTAEEMLVEAERVMATLHRLHPGCPIILAADSVAAMLVEDESSAGLDGQNMKSKMALPTMLSGLLRRWTGLLQVYNALAIFINQLRISPMKWGDPTYTPGGKALPFYAHVRVRMKRAKKGGRLKRAGKTVGIKAILRNDKNKAGGIEGAECGFKMYFDGRSQFFAASEIEEDDDE